MHTTKTIKILKNCGMIKLVNGIRNKCNLSFLSGSNANYIDELYELWKKDNNSVHSSWNLFFKASEKGLDLSEYYKAPPVWAYNINKTITPNVKKDNESTIIGVNNEQISVNYLVDSYRKYGHLVANINPLFQNTHIDERLTLKYWGLCESSLSKKFTIMSTNFGQTVNSELTLQELIKHFSNTYTSTIGYEYLHIDDKERVEWLRSRIEDEKKNTLNVEDKVRILERVSKSCLFEYFLSKKFPAEKRFGVEGCDVLISSMKEIIDTLSANGGESVVLGMAHRGRLNVLSNVCGQLNEYIFSRFNDELEIEGAGSSDVKYHLGVSLEQYNERSNKNINVSLVANPSHLEAVNPVVKGKVKAEQFLKQDFDGSKVICILNHGDAAFSGQGIVYETIQLSELKNYKVHGTIHIVTNNQIGFTTDPCQSRSTLYCTDVAKMVNAPIFHVNANDPQAVSIVSRIAAEYRQKFKKDVFIDIVGYRRLGHNEGDNPSFTQPQLYNKINSIPNVMEIYSKKLMEENVIDKNSFDKMVNGYMENLEVEFNKGFKAKSISNDVWIDSPWKGFFTKDGNKVRKSTGFSMDMLKKFQIKCANVPESFTPHPQIDRILKQRMKMLENNELDWAMGEIAAISSLLYEGIHVRLSGQDVQRGTFSHRHHVLHDYKVANSTYCSLFNIDPNQAEYSIGNSPLSEFSVLGFEHGYSMASPYLLAIWEAQFGDFYNNAQCIVDQFISSGQDKWIRQSGVVMLLPHGYDGMGPEHSSARIERFLQLSKEDPDVYPNYSSDEFELRQLYDSNWIVALPTTPANLFHLLRRQILLNFRKPLIIFSPKSLLRHELARSKVEDFGPGTFVQRIIKDDGECSKNGNEVKRHIFCSGKVYYDLVKERNSRNLDSTICITRIEQLSPFPLDLVSLEIEKYPNADLYYVQDEPKNQGAYSHVRPFILQCCNYSKPLTYVGRPVSASPATGNKHQHNIEQKNLVNDAFTF